MLVRTKASQVEKIWTGFFDRYPAAEDLARDDLDTVSSSLGSLGLTWRSARIHRLGRAMVDDVDWTKALPKLPGCGPYVTAATKIGMTGRGILPVDVTIARVLTRYYGIEGRGEPRRQKRYSTTLWHWVSVPVGTSTPSLISRRSCAHQQLRPAQIAHCSWVACMPLRPDARHLPTVRRRYRRAPRRAHVGSTLWSLGCET